jgi:TATA-binding protein-associated factor Taf7
MTTMVSIRTRKQRHSGNAAHAGKDLDSFTDNSIRNACMLPIRSKDPKGMDRCSIHLQRVRVNGEG